MRPQRPILFDKIPNNLLLSMIEPAGQGRHEKPDGVRDTSRKGLPMNRLPSVAVPSLFWRE